MRCVHLCRRNNTARLRQPAFEESHQQQQREEDEEEGPCVPMKKLSFGSAVNDELGEQMTLLTRDKTSSVLVEGLHVQIQVFANLWYIYASSLESRDKQPIEISVLKERSEHPGQWHFSLPGLISDRLPETDRGSLDSVLSAHLPAVYLKTGTSVKWQTCQRYHSANPWPSSPCPPPFTPPPIQVP